MDKSKAQEMAIRSKKDKEEEGEYDSEGGKRHKKVDAYRNKKDKKEEEGKMDKEGQVCKHCGKRK